MPARPLTTLLAAVLALGGCGQPQGERAGAGLASDEATVARIMAETGPEDWSLWFPHTGEELDEVMERNPDPELTGSLRTWGETDAADSFAGMWLDQAAGGVLTVAFAHDLDGHREQVRDRFGEGIRVVQAAHTLRALEQITEALRQEAPTDPEASPRVTGWGVDDRLNRVGISILGDDEPLRRQMSARFGAQRLCLRVEQIPDAADAPIASWEPAAHADLSPHVTSIPVLVKEWACASGSDAAGRIPDPRIAYDADAVTVTFRVIPRGGPQACPGHPPTPFTLELSEPLRARVLLDGGVDPPAAPDVERMPPQDPDR